MVSTKKWKICSRGHKFQKSSDCPVCPICWSGFYKEKAQSDFPRIGAPALRALLNHKVTRLHDLTKYTEKEILELHGMGPKAIGILKVTMSKMGYRFKD